MLQLKTINIADLEKLFVYGLINQHHIVIILISLFELKILFENSSCLGTQRFIFLSKVRKPFKLADV